MKHYVRQRSMGQSCCENEKSDTSLTVLFAEGGQVKSAGQRAALPHRIKPIGLL